MADGGDGGDAGDRRCAGERAAKRTLSAGTWAFQTEPYGNEQFGVIMSGAAIVIAGAARAATRFVCWRTS